jgi:uncharacterized membrane protein
VAHEAQLEWERRTGRLAAGAALVSAVLLLAGTVVRQAVALQSRPEDEREFLKAIDEESMSFIVSGVLQAVSFVALGVVLWYLFRATQYRREETPSWVLPLVLAGPVLLGAAAVVTDLDRLSIADDFLASGKQTEARAEDLLEDRGAAGGALGLAGTLTFAFGLVLVPLNAMRAGLLSRFMGILGMVLAAAYVLMPPIAGILQLFWVNALAVLFLGRWPGGRGPAWETGEAIPWPTAADRARAREGAEPPGDPPEPLEPEPPAERPASRKRRRS